ncbi:beta-N-acetylhexosaminidase [Tepidibacter hydrothermalis]|uniref:beta-N-acetylhexosaminidase n=1 Tax=Tepidibacter hydrothermalis TaxID=3036126 RepID=A0ABY8E7P0_9FIRM|nr:beta-N-acetylhexosaminidase [Tepidibacter hydrothermalis]WFD08915.1 beta-N-acetylhexosaminidase [Tepidibacter hydrothermalis]
MKKTLILSITTVLILILALVSINIKKTSDLDESDIVEEKKEKVLSKKEIEENEINDIMNSLSLEEKLGQMVIVGFNGYEVDSDFRDLLESYKVGGVILFKRNIKNSEQLLNLNNNIKSINSKNKLPLFISVDEEGGRITRLPEGSTKFPSNKVIGKENDKDLSYKIGKQIGTELNNFKFNMDFAPVLDIYSNPKNTVIKDRSFGTDSEIVKKLGVATMKGLQDSNVISVVKHFPGHGDTTVDSHIGLPVVNHDKQRLDKFELIPFKEAINNGVDAVMTAHIVLPNVDKSKKPATLSETILTDILRNELNFSGVIITDDMEMGAIVNNYGTKNASVEAIKAGADIVLMCHTKEKQIEALEGLKEAVNSGEISIERIDESVKRIIKLKRKYDLNDIKKKNN